MRSAGQEISRGRNLAATAALLVSSGIVAKEAIRSWGVVWLLLAFAGIIAAAGIGIARRSLVVQVVSRAAAWTVLAPALLVTVLGLFSAQMPPIGAVVLALTTGLALLLARPMLHTDTAKASFAPKAFRSLLLAGSTATAATGFVAGGIALDAVRHGFTGAFAAFAALAVALFASAIGVVRMRAWGILLGALTSVVLLGCAAFFNHHVEAVGLMVAAAPALLLHALPVLLARWGFAPSSTSVHLDAARSRVDVDLGLDELPSPAFTTAHLRVASDVAADAFPADADDVAVTAIERRASMRA